MCVRRDEFFFANVREEGGRILKVKKIHTTNERIGNVESKNCFRVGTQWNLECLEP